MIDLTSRGKIVLSATIALAGLALVSAADAQTMTANSASYNAGYGRVADEENQPVDVNLRDANGNLTVVDGVIQTGQDQSVFSNFGAGGVFDTASGVSVSSGATAVSTVQVVVTKGDNTVTDNSTQTNTGNVSASSSLSGGVSNAH